MQVQGTARVCNLPQPRLAREVFTTVSVVCFPMHLWVAVSLTS